MVGASEPLTWTELNIVKRKPIGVLHNINSLVFTGRAQVGSKVCSEETFKLIKIILPSIC